MIQTRQSAWVRSGPLGEIINHHNRTQQDQLGSKHSRRNLNEIRNSFLFCLFNGAVGRTHYTVSNGKMSREG
jgi:hypothetical protein